MVGPGGLTSGCAVKPLVWKSPRNQARVMAPSKSPETSPRVKEARMLGSPHPKQCEGHDNPHQLEWIPVLMRPSTFGTQSMQLELEQHTFHATVRLTHTQFGSFSVLQFPKVTLSFTYLHAYTTLIPHVKHCKTTLLTMLLAGTSGRRNMPTRRTNRSPYDFNA